MTLFRQHRGSFKEAMKTVIEVRDKVDLFNYLKHDLSGYKLESMDQLTITPYSGIDSRNGWDTYIVCINGAAIGFTNGPLN